MYVDASRTTDVHTARKKYSLTRLHIMPGFGALGAKTKKKKGRKEKSMVRMASFHSVYPDEDSMTKWLAL